MKNKNVAGFFVLSSLLFGQLTFASVETTGTNGINSSGLGLTGNGVAIGQVEKTRPGDKSFDTMASLINSTIDPAGVFYTSLDFFGTPSYSAIVNAANQIYIDAADLAAGGHSTQVAGMMISSDAAATGVAPAADLFSSGVNVPAFPTAQDGAAVAGQFIATQNSGNVRAINMSFIVTGIPVGLRDGTSTLSSFVDWSARVHDVLYVVAGEETTVTGSVPVDNFNGMTVAMSKKDSNGKYRIVDDDNIFSSNPLSPLSNRTYVDLLAPGRNVVVASQGNALKTVFGTSFATPHVTGTVALLQEYANTQIGNGVAGWNPNGNARRHEVMKAVLMNSADKIEDNGQFIPTGKATPVPPGGLLGMIRTVLKKDGTNWDDADASWIENIPLDEEMGAGHLNAARAVQQFSPGEFDPNGAPVPVIGWDYGDAGGLNSINKYVFNQELLVDTYISITLAWDREVTFSSDGGTAGVFDSGDEFNGYFEPDADDVINDLDLFLMPKGSTSTDPYIYNDAIWTSAQDFMPLEHMFIQIPATDEYEIWVRQADNDLGGGQDYGIA